MSQYVVLIYAGDSAHTGGPDESHEEDDRHARELAGSGAMLAAYALTPRERAISIRAEGVTDGPFIEAKEVVAGLYVLEAPDLDTAISIARTNPAVRTAGGGVEVRPVHSGGVVARGDR